MKVIITGRNIELTPSLKDFVEKKMDSINTYVEHLQEIDVTLSVNKTKSEGILHLAEVTIWATGMNFRATQSHPDMYAAIDLILDKLQRQVTRYKDKVKTKPRRKRKREKASFKHQIFKMEEFVLPDINVDAPVSEQASEAKGPEIVRSNQYSNKPMYIDEAAEQLTYLEQEFIVFSNAESGETNVVYKRSDGNIGLIEPHA